MRKKYIDVLKVAPGCAPERVTIENDLKHLQEAVDGLIETVYTGCDDGTEIICNEEGKINGMMPNRALFNEQGEIIDVVFGTFLVVEADTDGYFISLSEEMIEKYKKRFMFPEIFLIKKGKLCVVREGEAS